MLPVCLKISNAAATAISLLTTSYKYPPAMFALFTFEAQQVALYKVHL